MAKLYFRHGTVGSAKTLNLLAVAHNYRQQQKRILLIKPALDVRFGRNSIKSRAGLEKEADILVDEKTNLLQCNFSGISCVLVDEAQFLAPEIIDQLRQITHEQNIPVICYGLRTDFTTSLFPGSSRLMEIADSIEEVKSTCHYCNRKGIMNLKHVNGKATLAGPSVDLGADEKYFPTCYGCYKRELQDSGAIAPSEELAGVT